MRKKKVWRKRTTQLIYTFAHFFPISLSFHKRNDTEAIEECKFTTDDPIKGKIGNQDINDTFIRKVNESAIPLDCLWMIEVKPDWQVRVVQKNLILFFSLSFSVCVCLCTALAIQQFHFHFNSPPSWAIPFDDHIPSNQTITIRFIFFFLFSFSFAMWPVHYVLFSMYFF